MIVSDQAFNPFAYRDGVKTTALAVTALKARSKYGARKILARSLHKAEVT